MRPRIETSISWLFSTVHFQIINLYLYLYLHLYFYLRPPIDPPLPFLDLKLNRNSKCVALPPWTIWQICISPLFFISFPPVLTFLHWVCFTFLLSFFLQIYIFLLYSLFYFRASFVSFFSIVNLANMHLSPLFFISFPRQFWFPDSIWQGRHCVYFIGFHYSRNNSPAGSTHFQERRSQISVYSVSETYKAIARLRYTYSSLKSLLICCPDIDTDTATVLSNIKSQIMCSSSLFTVFSSLY